MEETYKTKTMKVLRAGIRARKKMLARAEIRFSLKNIFNRLTLCNSATAIWLATSITYLPVVAIA